MAEPGEMALRFCDIGFGVADRLSLLALDEGQLVIFRIDKPALVAAGCADVAGLLEAEVAENTGITGGVRASLSPPCPHPEQTPLCVQVLESDLRNTA